MSDQTIIEYGRFLSSLGLEKPDAHSLHRDKLVGDIARLFDHGRVVDRVTMLSKTLGEDVEGVEFGIVSRTYLEPDQTAMLAVPGGPLHGLKIVDLPMTGIPGRLILTFPSGCCADSIAHSDSVPNGLVGFVLALRNLPANEFAYALPKYLVSELLVCLHDDTCTILLKPERTMAATLDNISSRIAATAKSISEIRTANVTAIVHIKEILQRNRED